jgi:stage II sporulation protein M
VWQRFQEALVEHIRDQFFIYLLVIAVFTLGVALGALSVRLLAEEQVRELNLYFFGFVGFLAEQQPVNNSLILQNSLLQNGKFLAALWLCGSFFFGFAVVLILLFYRGFTIGFTVGFLAEQNAMRGVMFALSAVMPQNLVYIPVSMLAGVAAITLSMLHLRRRFGGKQFPVGAYLIQFTFLMLAAAAFLTLGGLIEALITPVFMRAMVAIL